MSNLPEKIQTATQELRYLQRNIEGGAAAAPKLAEIDMAAVREFKAVLDYVRQLVWNYIEADTRSKGQDADDEIRSLRLQRVTEMLQAIQQEAKVRQLTPSSATVSFLNAVQEIADQAFRKHLTSESDIEKAS
jgi:hypothetical protein